jgi:hypothetical protein
MNPFPPNPSTGDVVILDTGVAYQWDGEKWTAYGAPQTHPYLPLSGGAMDGMFTLAGDATQPTHPVTYEQLQNTIIEGGGFPEAPADGQVYGRNGQVPDWQPVLTTAAAANYLPLTGGTLSGALVLNGNATAPLNPVPLQQLPLAATVLPLMDGTAAIGTGATWARADHVHPHDTTLLALAGGSMTGALSLTGNAASALQAVPYQQLQSYVAANAGVTVSDTAPASPVPGRLWWDSVGGQLFLYYQDPNSAEWVVANSQAPGIADAPSDGTLYARSSGTWTSGGTFSAPLTTNSSLSVGGTLFGGTATFTGTVSTSGALTAPQVTVSADPTTALQVATKQYVDAHASVPITNDVGRNLIHNALFNVQQRGATTWTTGGYTVDRWRIDNVNATFSASVLAQSDANRAQIGDEAAAYYLSVNASGTSGANDYVMVNHRIENLRRTAGKTVTVSFYANTTSGSGLNLGVSWSQVFGSGGSPSATVYGTGQAVTPTATWARYSVTFNISSVSGMTFGTTAGTDFLQLEFWYTAGSGFATRSGIGVQSGLIRLWGVQCEVGSVMTPLEKIDPGLDLQRCQRFYQVGAATISGYSDASLHWWAPVFLPVQMRAIPTTTIAVSSSTLYTSMTLAGFAPAGWLQAAVTASASTGLSVVTFNFTASADL